MEEKPKFDKVLDSGTRQEFETGAVRDAQTGKGRYDLLPARALRFLSLYYKNAGSRPASLDDAKDYLVRVMITSDNLERVKYLTDALTNILDNIELDELKEQGLFDTGLSVNKIGTNYSYSIMPHRAIKRLAVHYENGAVKYGDSNWLKGIPMNRMYDSASRHLDKVFMGLIDEDHKSAAAWNIIGMIEYYFRIESGILPVSLDTLPKENNRPDIIKGV